MSCKFKMLIWPSESLANSTTKDKPTKQHAQRYESTITRSRVKGCMGNTYFIRQGVNGDSF